MPTGSSLSVDVLRVRSVTATDEERWRALASRAVEPNPSFEPEAVLAAAASDPAWTDASLLVVRDGDLLAACLPVRPVRPQPGLPATSLTTRIDPGPVPLLPVLGTPLVDPSRLGPSLACLLDALRTSRSLLPGHRRHSVLVIERWNDEGPVARGWRAACGQLGLALRIEHRWERPVLHAPTSGTGSAWPASLGAKRLADANRKRRRLAEELGAPVRTVDRAADRTNIAATLDDYVRLEGAGWKGRAGTSLSDTPDLAKAFRQACLRWADAGRLSLLTLEGAGRPLAIRCAVRSGQSLFLYRIAYDEAFGRHGPGVLLELDTGQYFLEQQDMVVMDPCCAPGNTFYPGFLPDRLPVATSYTALRPEGRVALALRPLIQRGARAARSVRDMAGGTSGGAGGSGSGAGRASPARGGGRASGSGAVG